MNWKEVFAVDLMKEDKDFMAGILGLIDAYMQFDQTIDEEDIEMHFFTASDGSKVFFRILLINSIWNEVVMDQRITIAS